ncbi:MAG: hypothetical protein N3F09_06885 [Bacteroidia bacterium]|nr:hypothetical protein [Bacteroidia bacterium]
MMHVLPFLKNVFFFLVLSGMVTLGAHFLRPQKNFFLWIELGTWMAIIFLLTSWLPYIFKQPVWPILYKSVVRLLGAAGLFVYYNFFYLPENSETSVIVGVYYLLYIFTDLYFALQKS